MLSIIGGETRLCDGLTRREVLRAGGLTVGGLSLSQLLAAQKLPAATSLAATSSADAHPTFGRAKNVIFLYLAGGPPQHETFDPKPDAPVEIRGPFQPIQTNVPGIQFCELLPRTAQLSHQLAVIRSMATDDNIHSSSSAWVLTGHKYLGANARMQTPADSPYFGSIVKQLRPSDVMPGLSTVWLPDVMRLNENVTPAGQTAGFLGPQWNPEVFVGDPAATNYEIESLRSIGIGPLRLDRRRSLLSQMELELARAERPGGVQLYDTFQQQAFDLLISGQARTAFDIAREPENVRDRYGRNRWGQCVLLARRLIEAGVRLVHVQWPREPGDNAVDNPLWDTHAQNADRVEDVLCPMFDVGFSALIEDLSQRGLLDETLVVAIGEFGRTPKINGKGGRDHWGNVFSCVLAGAGISGGQVYGASDKQAAYPIADRVRPGDLTATIFHLLGIPSLSSVPDMQGRPHRLTEGEPIYGVLGIEPATLARTASSADIARVPPFDPSRLLSMTNFADGVTIRSVDAPPRPKGWRAAPAIIGTDEKPFGVHRFAAGEVASIPMSHAAIGFRMATAGDIEMPEGTRAYLAQEVRSPFAGTFRFRARVRGDATSQMFFDNVFMKHFNCQLIFFQFNSMQKRADDVKPLATAKFNPVFRPADWQTVELSHLFANPNPGANFSFGAGMGIAIEVVRTTTGDLPLAGNLPQTAMLRIADVQLDFIGKERNSDVTV